jgi:alpha-tubulin suppressor-like RCC1 family protein
VTGGIAFTKLVAGHLHTCGMTAAGAAYCWGDNVYGEIGDNTVTNRLVPTAVH